MKTFLKIINIRLKFRKKILVAFLQLGSSISEISDLEKKEYKSKFKSR